MQLSWLKIQPRHYAAILVLLCYAAFLLHPLMHLKEAHLEGYAQSRDISLMGAASGESDEDCAVCRQGHGFVQVQAAVVACLWLVLAPVVFLKCRPRARVRLAVADIQTRGPPAL